MVSKKYATTFGGSEFTSGSPEYQDSYRIGMFLAQCGYTVKCGGYYGLMEAVSKGAKDAGGECIGITNASFDPKAANAFISSERKACDLFERLRWLIQDSELFVIQNGSFGTLVELMLVWCLKYTRTLPSISICLIGECWKPAVEGLRHLAIKEEFFSYITIYQSVDHFIEERGK